MSLELKKTEYNGLVADVVKLQGEYVGKAMPPAVGKEFEDKAKKAKELQVEIEEIEGREKQVVDLKAFQREIPSGAAIVPETGTGSGQKAEGSVVAYMTPGEAFVRSGAYKHYKAAGMPEGSSEKFQFDGSLHDETRFIPLDRKAFDAEYQGKAIPTITGVIQPDRITEIVRSTERDRLVVRDVVQVTPTASSSVEYIRITSALPIAALPVAESAAKPESTVAMDKVTTPVRTLAVWMPITEQQLADVPQIRSVIDDELTYDIARLEEYQMIWGPGTGENLLGIMKTSGVAAARSVGGDTFLDRMRRGMTDILKAGHEPNAAVVDPVDYEAMVLLKGTDNHYLFQAFPDGAGRYRIWGLQVVETPAATEYRSANATDERVILVGDFKRGATLWDRQQTAVAVGYINDQFTKNQRTIRAEERIAFGVKRPSAFRFVQTVAPVA